MHLASLLLGLTLLTTAPPIQEDASQPAQEEREQKRPRVYRGYLGKRAPDFVLKDLDGRAFVKCNTKQTSFPFIFPEAKEAFSLSRSQKSDPIYYSGTRQRN